MHKARKRFGQHFLHDPAVIGRIIDALELREGQRLIEIGPGQGALTFKALALKNKLDVIEVDRDLAAKLRAGSHPGLTVHECDALQFDLASLAEGGEKLKIFGNLPYNISTPLLFHLLDYSELIADMLFMLQREVVARMCSTPGTKVYGRLTVMLAAVARVERLFDIGPGAFKPPPKVVSAMVRIVPLSEPLVSAALRPAFASIVSAAFGQRRKTLRNSLAKLLHADQILNAGLDPQQRPETVDPGGFAALAQQSESG